MTKGDFDNLKKDLAIDPNILLECLKFNLEEVCEFFNLSFMKDALNGLWSLDIICYSKDGKPVYRPHSFSEDDQYYKLYSGEGNTKLDEENKMMHGLLD